MTATGALRDWLATRREELNGRFRLARRRFPQLDPGAVLTLTRELLTPLPFDSELYSAVYDLILLHVGRATLTPDGGSVPGLGVLLRETFPRIVSLLLDAPRSLPGALSNAVENSGRRGVEFARRLASVAGQLSRSNELLDAGVVLAWRLGDARCREAALEIAPRLTPRALLAALDLAAWPDAAAPLAVAVLTRNGWRDPASMFAPETLSDRRQIASLIDSFGSDSAVSVERWMTARSIGDFTGFDGQFEQPPLLLADDRAMRHRCWVRVGQTIYRVNADVYGWSCQPDGSVDFPVAVPTPSRKGAKLAYRSATSLVQRDEVLLYTLADSFRIRVLTPPLKLA